MSEDSRPRRGIPADEFDADAFSQSVLEITAVRRALHVDEKGEPLPPESRPARALGDPDDSLTTSYRRASGGSARPLAHRTAAASEAASEPPTAQTPGDGPAARLPRSLPARAGVTIATAVIAVLVFAASTQIPTMPKPAPPAGDLVSGISRICPAVTRGEFRWVAADGHGKVLPLVNGVSVITPTEPRDSVAGGTLISGESESYWAACIQQRADQYIHLPLADDAVLTVVNAESSDALVDVTLTGPDGEIPGTGLRGVSIPAGSTQTFALADYAPGVAGVGARVRASTGRVLAYADYRSATGPGLAQTTELGTFSLITGIPEDATKVELIISNPGTTRSTVQLTSISEAGSSVLAGYESHVLNARRTAVIDITEDLPKVASGLAISGEEAFSASLLVTREGSSTLIPAVVDTSADLFGPIVGSGTLMVVNASAEINRVTIDWGEGQAPMNRDIAVGTLLAVPIADGAEQVRVASSGQVGATVVYDVGLATELLTTVAPVRASIVVEPDPKIGR